MKRLTGTALGAVALYAGVALIALYAASQLGVWSIYVGGLLIGIAYGIARS